MQSKLLHHVIQAKNDIYTLYLSFIPNSEVVIWVKDIEFARKFEPISDHEFFNHRGELYLIAELIRQYENIPPKDILNYSCFKNIYEKVVVSVGPDNVTTLKAAEINKFVLTTLDVMLYDSKQTKL